MSNSPCVKTILILAANPTDTSRLRLDREVKAIGEVLRRSNKREQFELEQTWAVSKQDFYQAILDYQPQIVHFCGHGTGEDGIVLEDEMGQLELVKADWLARQFQQFAETGVKCVLLNACYSQVQAQAISQYIKYVIGMNRTVGDSVAIAFAVAFYSAIGAGKGVEFAYKLAESQIDSSSEQQISVLLTNSLIEGFKQESNNNLGDQLFALPKSANLLPEKYLKERRTLLDKVWSHWVKNNLEQSFYNEHPIQLRLEQRLDLLELVSETPEHPKKLLPRGTKIINKFDEIGQGRTLLILGDPGVGKTITLLELARDLITRAKQDDSLLIPVLFNLSSWAGEEQTIVNWLVQELNLKYQVEKEFGETWIKEERLLLLLDGLDQIDGEKQQNSCVTAINEFRQKYGNIEIVVCSRTKDYESLSSRLKFQYAICIQNLTIQEIHQYLDNAVKQLQTNQSSLPDGEEANQELEKAVKQLRAVKALLKKDTELQELVKTPLILSIMRNLAKDTSIQSLIMTGTLEERRQRLFVAYIQRMLQRRKSSKYSEEDVKYWLIWLAQQMGQGKDFLIEQIQPSWLQTEFQRRSYRFLIFLLSVWISAVYGFIFGVFNTVFIEFLTISQELKAGQNYVTINPFATVIFGVGMGLIIGCISGLIIAIKNEITPVEVINFSFINVQRKLTNLYIGNTFRVILWFIKKIQKISIPSPEFKLNKLSSLCEVIKANLEEARKDLNIPIVLLILFPFVMAKSRFETEGFDSAIFGFISPLIIFLFLGLGKPKVSEKVFPNQGIIESRRNSFNVLLIGNTLELVCLCLLWKLLDVPESIILHYALMSQVIILIFSLLLGGAAYIQHSALRLILQWNRYIPKDYAYFLDYAAQIIILRKFGGSYSFFHPLLQKHFIEIKELDKA